MNLPNDPLLLMSVVNTKLRDYYADLDALCDDLNVDRGRADVGDDHIARITQDIFSDKLNTDAGKGFFELHRVLGSHVGPHKQCDQERERDPKDRAVGDIFQKIILFHGSSSAKHS